MKGKKEMTAYEQSLFNELKREAKVVNQRILRLERLVEKKEPFAVKQLADYLSIEGLNAWTKTGRVAVRKSFDSMQMKAILKQLRTFKESPQSRVAGVKEIKKIYEERMGKKLSYKQASSIYQAKKQWTWIRKYMTDSEWWDFARECVKEGWTYETFEENIMTIITDSQLDEELKRDLQDLYDYTQGVTGV